MKHIAAISIFILAIVAVSSSQNCDDVMCTMYCEYGFKTNANGCDICECNDKTEIRDGQCPQIDEDATGICEEACEHDGVCPTNQKCCSNGCGHACMDIVNIKVGYCPVAGGIASGMLGTCANMCQDDSSCNGTQKCCKNACSGTQCVEPATEKRGTCPTGSLKEGTLGLCANLCDRDDDCQALQKCCSNGCGNVCVTPDDLPEIHAGSCPAVQSESGPGVCANMCDNDGKCGDEQKCCKNNCGGYVCVDAIDVPVKCPEVSCLRYCAYGRQIDENGCEICKCIEEPTVINEGECPVEKSGDIGICSENCDDDGDCEPNQKCCSNNCGHVCLEAITMPSDPEACPINAFPEGGLGACVEECSASSPCPSGEICCSNGCGHSCTKPVTVNQGTCPVGDLKLGWSGVCVEMCNSDGQCASNQKCCSNGCGHVCITVEQEPETCPDVVCQIFCEYGNKKDSNGCNMCECQDAPSVEVERTGDCPVGFLPEGIVGTCAEECSSDDDCTTNKKCCSNGCGHVCVNAVNVKAECPPVLCTRYCENGLQKDNNGCEICACNEDQVCDPVLCTIHCPYGNKLDGNGCPICDCKEPPAKCEVSVCSDFCAYGYQRDSEGCEVCQCTSSASALVVREGTCPAVSDGNAGSCADLCDNDEECGDGDKCCFNGCGLACTGSSADFVASSIMLLSSTVLLVTASWKL